MAGEKLYFGLKEKLKNGLPMCYEAPNSPPDPLRSRVTWATDRTGEKIGGGLPWRIREIGMGIASPIKSAIPSSALGLSSRMATG